LTADAAPLVTGGAVSSRLAAGGAGDAIRAIQPPPPTAGLVDCCSEVLKRLDWWDKKRRERTAE